MDFDLLKVIKYALSGRVRVLEPLLDAPKMITFEISRLTFFENGNKMCDKSYVHVSGLAQRTGIFEGAEFSLIFDESPKSVMATANSFRENKTFLKSDRGLSKVLRCK